MTTTTTQVTDLSAIRDQMAELDATVKDMRTVLRRLGKAQEEAVVKLDEYRRLATPIIIGLARAGIPQSYVVRDYQTTRETIRRIEIKYGVDRGDPRTRPGSRDSGVSEPESPLAPYATIDEMRAELRGLGRLQATTRKRLLELRRKAIPLIVALAEAKVAQGDIVRDFRTTRETIRRVEMEYGVDRQDPRAKPGSRAGKFSAAELATLAASVGYTTGASEDHQAQSGDEAQ